MRVCIDMTGWVMKEHGVPDSRLTVIERAEDYIQPNGRKRVMWKCKCSCNGENSVVVVDADRVRRGITKSCGCVQQESRKMANKKENKFDISGEFGILWSTNTNEEVYFDLKDSEKILQHTWFVCKNGYASTHIGREIVTMHTFLGYHRPDHHNRNRLDNRSENLILATCTENSRNMSKRRDNTSGYTGVFWKNDINKWCAFIVIDGKTISCGVYVDKNDAVIARLKAEARYYGEFAPQRHLFEEYGISLDNVGSVEIIRPLRSNNTSGCAGVSWDKRSNKWAVEIRVNKQKIWIGHFSDIDEAIRARLLAEIEHIGEQHAPQKHLFEKYGIVNKM